MKKRKARIQTGPGKGYAHGDKCPECESVMTFEKGDLESRMHPGTPDCIYCPECGLEYEIDWDRHEMDKFYCGGERR